MKSSQLLHRFSNLLELQASENIQLLMAIIEQGYIVFIRSGPDILWKCYKNTANSRTKKENIEIYENGMLSVIKVGIEPTK